VSLFENISVDRFTFYRLTQWKQIPSQKSWKQNVHWRDHWAYPKPDESNLHLLTIFHIWSNPFRFSFYYWK